MCTACLSEISTCHPWINVSARGITYVTGDCDIQVEPAVIELSQLFGIKLIAFSEHIHQMSVTLPLDWVHKGFIQCNVAPAFSQEKTHAADPLSLQVIKIVKGVFQNW
jgi:hypothetical protein